MQTWRTFRRLKPSERSLALEAAFALVCTRIGLSAFGYRSWQSVAEKFAPLRSPAAQTSTPTETASSIVRMEAAAARHLFFTPTCLVQSIVLAGMLRRRGLDAHVQLGGRKTSGQFEAHAWVELDGAVFDPTSGANSDFVPFADASFALENRAAGRAAR